ncbi:hypothetical protein VMT65_37035 [Nocardia sp. CDC153]|uniref:hypothetical protein n=1 Tax=Nocardia sp. CDC153 TaxID=3112167 RepID=UPI002DB6C5ED|nr:hypothetical protein [Nocardia sp. CDC153]MEC3958691.1 hypothetical protein [Nocardia sp. CDC153]
MCEGYGLIASFETGTAHRPQVPELVQPSLALTDDGLWVILAHKVAHRIEGELFVPATGGTPYPVDAVAECRRGRSHAVPDPDCSCGFHAVSESAPNPYGGRFTVLEVALSGRILASYWMQGGLLFRAERQTVLSWSDATVPQPIRVPNYPPHTPPTEPGGRTARLRRPYPRDLDSVGLRLPESPPPFVRIADDPGYCVGLKDERAKDQKMPGGGGGAGWVGRLGCGSSHLGDGAATTSRREVGLVGL